MPQARSCVCVSRRPLQLGCAAHLSPPLHPAPHLSNSISNAAPGCICASKLQCIALHGPDPKARRAGAQRRRLARRWPICLAKTLSSTDGGQAHALVEGAAEEALAEPTRYGAVIRAGQTPVRTSAFDQYFRRPSTGAKPRDASGL
ncbi:hypothetical protein CDD83_9474 [Cordyceps sp. RAO-2017]|nr:hypothetical protein CDD83_9474 [Cordyceps sp. RAO-2017]